ncbi:uncharacterized protein MYCFIDRAFT_198121 [Pseudocercospora fijiensis CIRAD86]|uniref:Ketoreductase (KR) domain-containing protein n=1 Tax=Pseudocercospora fijiensis (strain CIRAD86) TaxID=383855 RepID=M3A9S3_PSEFD|nr:uncharacterized protein MYCFIDRAFT_198121 [Pseudocercospora fijiensis CIRAD86]EME81376.1 hypothetical protein MYCFIDRAFT_198121 [Pseudocercospora fijiensis CIRAD86]
MGFQYKKVLLIGPTSGVVAVLAETLFQNDVFVIGVGRRKEHLEEFVNKHDSSNTKHRDFDINDHQRTALASTTTQLAVVTLHSRPNYGASKAALYHSVLALRHQGNEAGQQFNVLEVYP